MTTIIAKPIIADQFWILTDGTQKIGNLVSDGNGYEIKLHGNVQHYPDLSEVTKEVAIRFESGFEHRSVINPLYDDYPVDGTPHNIMLDVKRKLQLYTKEDDSKCYYASGYFNIKIHDRWQTLLCPKYIYIQRYEWHGPYRSREEALLRMTTDKYSND